MYASLTNGGRKIQPSFIRKEFEKETSRLISETTSNSINKILRKVVTDDEGTAKLADVHGYSVGGKTGTSQNYKNKEKHLNTLYPFSNKQTQICFIGDA